MDVRGQSIRIPGLWGVLAVCALLAACALLTGCGSESHPTPTLSPKRTPQGKNLRPRDPMDDMVAATAVNRAGSPVQLRYELSERPEVGQTVTLDVALIPVAPAEHVSVHFQGTDALAILDGADLAPVEKPAEGTPIHHALRFLAKRDGIFTLDAVVSAASGGQVIERSYSIPVIAGKGLPDLPRADGPATAAAATQRKSR